MFDAQTSRLIRSAPRVTGVDPAVLPQELTRIYTELAALRLRASEPELVLELRQQLDWLRRVATIYEAGVDRGVHGEARRAAAFVAGTAYQILGRVLTQSDKTPGEQLLSSLAIHPNVAAPLLFLIADQNPDAREAARVLQGARSDDLLRTALVESVYDLATEQFDSILERAERLRAARPTAAAPIAVRATQALYGLCWSGLVQIVARLLGRDEPETEFARFELPQAAFDQVVRLATEEISLPDIGGHLISTYGGPRHLARLLRHVAEGLQDAGISKLPPPSGSDSTFWSKWLRHRAQSKPVLWRNHRTAIATGFLEPGRSAVLVLPTGAGKTTLSELKIASTLAAGRKVIFLVPTLALVDQLRDDLSESFPSSLGDIEVSADGDVAGFVVAGPELRSIEVMTPERCLALMSFTDADVQDVGLIVFDECHLLSREGGGARSVDAMLCLLHATKRAPVADVLLLSAMISNATEVADWLEKLTGRPCQAFQDSWKPSRQARGVVIYDRTDLNTIRSVTRRVAQMITRTKGNKLNQAVPYALFGLHHNWVEGASEDIRVVRVSDNPVHLSIGAAGRVTPNANEVGAAFAIQAAHAKLKTILFVQQADHAPSTARKVSAKLVGLHKLTASEELLWASIQAEVGGEAHSLLAPTSAALPHNGDMIALERRLAESLFRRADGVNVIVATPTLAQGMNLPAELAILAGDKRHEGDARAALERHEILNAAGRAGRAGYLANGIVLLIPEPVIAFDSDERPEWAAYKKLRSVLPVNDQCVTIEDPLTSLLDQILTGQTAQPKVQYLLSRLRAGEELGVSKEAALVMMRRSLAAYQASIRGNNAVFEEKIDALKSALANEGEESPNAVSEVAAFSGMTVGPLQNLLSLIEKKITTLPTSIVGWSDWLIEFFREDQASFISLLGGDVDTIQYVVRGKKTGGLPSDTELGVLQDGMRAWLTGRSLREIELSLGVPEAKLKSCSRARDLALKLANRGLYMVASAVSELTRRAVATTGVVYPNPAVLEILAVAFRKGLDSPEKVAFANLHPEIRSRVLVHEAYRRKYGSIPVLSGLDYAGVLSHISFGEFEDIMR